MALGRGSLLYILVLRWWSATEVKGSDADTLAILAVEVTAAMKRGREIDGRVYDDHGAHVGRVERTVTRRWVWHALDADGALLKACKSKPAAVLAVLEGTCTWGPATGWTQRAKS
jgi:hypothetical protein